MEIDQQAERHVKQFQVAQKLGNVNTQTTEVSFLCFLGLLLFNSRRIPFAFVRRLRACLRIVAADVRRRKIVRLLARNPPPHVGGYSTACRVRLRANRHLRAVSEPVEIIRRDDRARRDSFMGIQVSITLSRR